MNDAHLETDVHGFDLVKACAMRVVARSVSGVESTVGLGLVGVPIRSLWACGRGTTGSAFVGPFVVQFVYRAAVLPRVALRCFP